MSKKYHIFIIILLLINIYLTINLWIYPPDMVIQQISLRTPQTNGETQMVGAVIGGLVFITFMSIILFPVLFLGIIFLIITLIKIFKTNGKYRIYNIVYSSLFLITIVLTIIRVWVI